MDTSLQLQYKCYSKSTHGAMMMYIMVCCDEDAACGRVDKAMWRHLLDKRDITPRRRKQSLKTCASFLEARYQAA